MISVIRVRTLASWGLVPLAGGACALADAPAALIVLTCSAVALLSTLLTERFSRPNISQTQAFVQGLIDVIPEPVYVKDEHGRYILINEAFACARGQSAADILGRTARDLAPDPDTADLVAREDEQVLGGLKVYKEDLAHHPDDGEPRWRIVTKGACVDKFGRKLIVGANFDITRMRQAEQQLQHVLDEQTSVAERTRQFIQTLLDEIHQHRHTHEFVQRVLDLLPWPVYVKDAQSRYIMVNEAMARDSFIPREELLNTTGLADNASAATMRAHFEEDGEVLAGRRILREEQILHPNTGRDTFRILAKARCLDAQGEPVIVGSTVDLTELRQTEHELKVALERETRLRERTEAFIQRLIDVIPDPFYVKRDGRYILINEAFAEYHGHDRKDLLDPSQEFPHLSDFTRQRPLEEDRRVLEGAEVLREEHTHRRLTGEEVYRVVSKRLCVYIDGEPVVVGIDRNITQWRLAEREIRQTLARETALRENTQHFVQRLIDLIPDPVYVKKSAGHYMLVNDAFLRYHDRSRSEVLAGPNSMRFEDENARRLSLEEDEAVLSGAEVHKEERTIRRATGEEVFRIVTKRRSSYFDGEAVVVGIDHHITRWRVAEHELQRLAREDALTGLANRRHFSHVADMAIERAARYGEALSLVMLDLDHFKQINDKYGHNVGDEVLRKIVSRNLVCLRAPDLLARWGGEEFIVLLPHTRLDEACQVAERLREAAARTPVVSSRGQVSVTLSAGVAQWQAGMGLDQLVSTADSALYAAKQAGRNCVNP